MTMDQQLVTEACVALGVSELRPLKDGGQKTVRLVQRTGTTFVLKVVALGSSHPDALERARREVDLLMSIDDIHVVRPASTLIVIGTPPRCAAWLEEHLDGDDLGDHMGSQWPWDKTLEMAQDVAHGLAALHEVRVVHRDLSANNVRRLSDGSFKIMDPGFARHTLRSGITVGGQPGTPGYMSPEHVHAYSGAPTAASDVFTVGILMYQALTGDLPVPYLGDAAEYISRLRVAQHVPIGTVRPDLTTDQCDVVSRCLHPQPARRYLNGARLAEALDKT